MRKRVFNYVYKNCSASVQTVSGNTFSPVKHNSCVLRPFAHLQSGEFLQNVISTTHNIWGLGFYEHFSSLSFVTEIE